MMINPGSVMPLSVRACGMLRPHSPVWAERIANYVRVPRSLHAPLLITTAKWDTFIFDLPRSGSFIGCGAREHSRNSIAGQRRLRKSLIFNSPSQFLNRKPSLLQRLRRSGETIISPRDRKTPTTSDESIFVRGVRNNALFGNQRMRGGKGQEWARCGATKQIGLPLFLPPLPITLFAPVYKQGAASCWRI